MGEGSRREGAEGTDKEVGGEFGERKKKVWKIEKEEEGEKLRRDVLINLELVKQRL